MTRYRLASAYCPAGKPYTLTEANALVAALFGESVTLREQGKRLIRVSGTSGFGIVIGEAIN